ncbi:enoyl-CoA hydratase-related protein [Pelagicoccus sp. SDUM812003]|uniref:enoyl-CoA hydratase/isomerase family protein n=1 Tax=Pelagicoccus sp. SDUM812003 TaxID=3041267 RepID=UPI00280FF66D|nr:enoyl-CoA hydratase-related protein [Pelagicoccus sp. SDUM812003]MDQ8201414.1 enoyl-CoA hydratase-related protein [Pelagicoccus sp. SDUM812003]
MDAAQESKDWVRYEVSGAVGSIVFARPKANAYTRAFMEAFHAALDAAVACERSRVIVIRSALERFFCAGADIAAFSENDTESNKLMVDLARAALAKIEESSKLFVAALAGHALGGGLEIAMACDLRIAKEGSYQIGLPEVKLGLLPGNGGTQRLLRLVGASKAMELMALGRNVHPAEAYAIGLVNRLYPESEFEAKLQQDLETIAEGPPLTLAALKRSLQEGRELSLLDGLALEARLVDSLYETEDAKEGFRAFCEKRSPNYTGR